MRALLACVALLVAACSSSSGGKPSSSSLPGSSLPRSSSPSLLPTHGGAPELTSQLLSVRDLPAGWSVDNSASGDSASTPPCLANSKAAFHATVKTERDFLGGTDYPRINEQIGYFASSANATTRFNAGKAVLDGCKTVSFTSGGTRFTGTIGALSFPTVGDRSAAWRLTISAGGETAALDAVVVQKSAELMMMVYGNVGSVDVGPLTTFVRKAVAKLPS